jgi:hypothetical protein
MGGSVQHHSNVHCIQQDRGFESLPSDSLSMLSGVGSGSDASAYNDVSPQISIIAEEI